MIDDLKRLRILARRTLHTAFVWNDHNFEHPALMARETAKGLGITGFNEANDFLERMNRIRLTTENPETEA